MRQIEDCPNFYINEQGEVFELKKCTMRIANNGYWMIHMKNKYGKRVYKTLHRMLAKAFIPNPENKNEIAHNDGNRANVCLTNLRWATRKENHADKIQHGTAMIGEKNHRTKLTAEQVLEIRKYYEEKKYTGRQLARMYSTHFGNISSIVTRKNWKHI